jgi:hypothetical protein
MTAAPMLSAQPTVVVVRSANGVARPWTFTISLPSPSPAKAFSIASAILLARGIASALVGAVTVSWVWRILVWLGSGSKVASAAKVWRTASKARVT